jgi:hypothetical protein
MTDDLHALAAGNNNAGGLALVTALTTPSGFKFPAPRALGAYLRGVVQQRESGLLSIAGKPSIVWTWDVAETDEYYAYLSSTYCAGGLSGLVTVRTSTTQAGTYANFNAIMQIKQHGEVERNIEAAWQTTLTATFIKMVAL